jgi:regulator of protease activity HflC (stomatin/prohibitin superfamily)
MALIEQQQRILDRAEDKAIPNPQPAAEMPAPQQEVGQNLPQSQPGMSPAFRPGDATVAAAVAEATPTAVDATATNVTEEPAAPQQTTEQAARALLDHIALAFAGRFPSDPKPGRAWFANLKALAFNLNDTL